MISPREADRSPEGASANMEKNTTLEMTALSSHFRKNVDRKGDSGGFLRKKRTTLLQATQKYISSPPSRPLALRTWR